MIITTAWPGIGMNVTYYNGRSLENEPKTITDAYNTGNSLVGGPGSRKERLNIGGRLVDFAIREAARVVSPS